MAQETIAVLSKSILRGIHESDIESLVKVANNPAVAANLRDIFPQPYTREDAETWVAICAAQKPLYNYTLIHPTTGAVMGGIGFKPGEDVHRRTAELGYWLGEEYWGQGVMSEVVPVFVEWAFKTFDGEEGLLRIWAGMFAENKASEKIVRKAGFEYEARMRANVWKNGRVMDQLLYARIRSY